MCTSTTWLSKEFEGYCEDEFEYPALVSAQRKAEKLFWLWTDQHPGYAMTVRREGRCDMQTHSTYYHGRYRITITYWKEQ